MSHWPVLVNQVSLLTSPRALLWRDSVYHYGTRGMPASQKEISEMKRTINKQELKDSQTIYTKLSMKAKVYMEV
ncbi:hypothetical protein QJS04_geneDACA000527 [Acorus gramineus]|uniref:Uncharacterized protein n=1 Tax=Acorus gramineus TaxID=55184 RepID=A0AAV9AQA1_ACOGR|nr:hypothetical protein QJS04_geneDACA000527 [Acorus gramineus]